MQDIELHGNSVKSAFHQIISDVDFKLLQRVTAKTPMIYHANLGLAVALALHFANKGNCILIVAASADVFEPYRLILEQANRAEFGLIHFGSLPDSENADGDVCSMTSYDAMFFCSKSENGSDCHLWMSDPEVDFVRRNLFYRAWEAGSLIDLNSCGDVDRSAS